MRSARPTLSIAIVVVIVLALLPRSGLRVVTWFNRPVALLLAPIEGPTRRVMVWLTSTRAEPGPAVDPQKWDEALRELNAARQENEDLRRMVKDLSRGAELNPGLAVRQIAATVIGYGGDPSGGLITVKAGRRDGVESGAVVVVHGVHLLGRVVRADDWTCSVAAITDPGFTKLFRNQRPSGVIMLDETKRGPTWRMESIEDGRLVGRVFYEGDEEGSATGERPAVEVGMLVRLRDDTWPAGAQMLVIGKIVRVDVGAHERPVVAVRPLHELSHASEVMVRVAGGAK